MTKFDKSTLDFLDRLRQKTTTPDITPLEELAKPDTNLGDTIVSKATSPGKTIVEAGGQALTQTISKIAAVGNFFPALLNEISTNNPFDKAYGMQSDGSYVNPGQFTGSGLLSGLKDNVDGAVATSLRVAGSKNLNDLSTNMVSGAELLKNLPGQIGEAFRVDDARTRVGTSILGFTLEVILDPTSKLASVAKYGTKGVNIAGKQIGRIGGMADVTAKMVSSGRISERTADFITKGAAHAATGNWVAGPAVMGLRELSAGGRELLFKAASNPIDSRLGKSAAKWLEYVYGPMSMARDEFKPLAAKLVSLNEELPKRMLKASGLSAMAVATLPARVRNEAKELLGVVAGSVRTSEESLAATEQLVRLGVKPQHIDAIASQFHDANRELIGFLDQGRGVVKGFDDIKLTPEHVAEHYYIHADRRSAANWTDYLIARNTPGSWQIRNLGIQESLEARLGITSTTSQPKTSAVLANNPYEGGIKSQERLRTALATSKDGLTPPARTTLAPGAISADELHIPRVTKSAVGKSTANEVARNTEAKLKNLALAIEKIDDQMLKLNPNGERMAFKSDGPLARVQLKLIERKNSLIAQQDHLEALMAKQNVVADDIGVPGHVGNFLTDKLSTGSKIPTPPNELIGGAVPSTQKLTKPTIIGEKDVFTPEQRKDFIEALIEEANVARMAPDRHPKLFAIKEDGSYTLEFEKGAKKDAYKQTLDDLIHFTDNYLDNLPVVPSKEVRAELHKAVKESIAYRPGDREFVFGLRSGKDLLKDSNKVQQYLVDSGIYAIDDANRAVIAEPHVDDMFKPLLGEIKEFTARSAIQATGVSELAADVHILSEMKKRNLVRKLDDIPEAERKFYAPIDKYSEEGLYAHRMDVQTINAIKRSLDSGLKGVPPAVMWVSSMFKRNALMTNPASHATQFLGNLAMLKMSGYTDMFRDTPKFAKDMRDSYTAILSSDQLYQEAVHSGVTVGATVFDNATKESILRHHLTQPKHPDMKATMTSIFSGLESLGAEAATRTVRGFVDASEKLGASTIDSFNSANQNLSLAAKYQLSDQLLRIYVFKNETAKGVNALVKANPSLAGWVNKKGLIDIDSLDKYHMSQAGQVAPVFDSDTLDMIKTAYSHIKEESAKIANDVGLNMADMPRAITYLGRSGVVPFVSYQAKSTGRTLQWLDEKPWVFSPFYTAQRNALNGMSDDPADFESDLAALPQNVRGALVIPTLEKNERNEDMYIDMGRLLPFGNFTQAAGGGTPEYTGELNSIVSAPITDLLGKVFTQEGRQPNQSMAAFIAGQIANTFAPAAIGAGSKQLDSLTRAIEMNKFSVDADGNVTVNEPTPVQKAIVAYNELPERVGHAIGSHTGIESAMGNPEPNAALRVRTTADVALTRMAIPGYGQAVDKELTFLEQTRRIDSMISQLERQRSSFNNEMELTPADGASIEKINKRIEQLQLMKSQQSSVLRIGE